MTESGRITKELLSECRHKGHDFTIANFYFGRYEYDVFSITKSGFVYEYEIKISRADYAKDFKNKLEKHEKYANSKEVTKPNRYYFVCPEGLLDIKEIPSYAGLIHINQRGRIFIIKEAPYLHKLKAPQSIYKAIATKLYWRYINMLGKQKK